MMDKFSALKKNFGYDSFRNGQEDIVNSLINGRDVLCVMPTGAGKSICYQVPALLKNGVTLVISPLISLMKDQVNALSQSGVAAAYINSSLSVKQYNAVCEKILDGSYKIIYVAPERLLNESFSKLFLNIEIDMIAVDEAHCVSQWGQDFRPSYLEIDTFINTLNKRPVVGAFTATATKKVKEDISSLLNLKNPFELTTGFDRPNLHFSVLKIKNKTTSVVNYLKENKDLSGIIYCSTRNGVDKLYDILSHEGFDVAKYHAGLSDSERKINQEDFLFDNCKIMVATNAFGMGIDKSNVSFVIHFNMPKDIESYYQEAGRAGRDGQNAKCILYYSGEDVRLNHILIDKSDYNADFTIEQREEIKEKQRQKLKYMTFYSTTSDCLRAFILKYFGQASKDYCGNCSNCESGYVQEDVTVESQKILSCVARTGGAFGVNMIINILRGSKNERIINLELNNQSTYGLLQDYPADKIKCIINHLVVEGYAQITDSKYPLLILTEKSKSILFKGKKVILKTLKEIEPPIKIDILPPKTDAALLTKLKVLRATIAKKAMVPAFVIFTDAALVDMCHKMPKTDEEFLEVSGVGEVKLKRYGDEFLTLIKKYIENNK